MPDHNLLSERVISIDRDGSARSDCSLPEVLALLSSMTEVEFSALQSHQIHPWYTFLVQLAAIALHRDGTTEIEHPAERWRDLLLSLTADDPTPWCLVVEDLAQAAFLQPPIPELDLKALKNRVETPDEMDMLVTSKNHDVKRRRIRLPRPEHWLFTLVTLQTMQGFSGKSNYGVSRMNTGYGNRAGVSTGPDAHWARRFIRDLKLLLEIRDDVATQHGFKLEQGKSLLWLLPWNGRSSIELTELDPMFIEICRRVRLAKENGQIHARVGNSHTRRINAEALKGNVGDPWIPIRIEDAAALTARSLDYTQLYKILFGEEFKPSAASSVRSDDGDSPVVIARILARGQGATKGIHERILPIPPRSRSLLASPEGRAKLGNKAKYFHEIAATVRGKVLRPALIILAQGGPEKPNYKDDRCNDLANELDRRVDQIFFERLFDALQIADADRSDREWAGTVVDLARRVLSEAESRVPGISARRWRALSRAHGFFEASARKHFPDVYPNKGGESDEQPSRTAQA